MLKFACVLDNEFDSLTLLYREAGRAEAHGVQHLNFDGSRYIRSFTCFANRGFVVAMSACMVAAGHSRRSEQ
jgi:hypothetical protein